MISNDRGWDKKIATNAMTTYSSTRDCWNARCIVDPSDSQTLTAVGRGDRAIFWSLDVPWYLSFFHSTRACCLCRHHFPPPVPFPPVCLIFLDRSGKGTTCEEVSHLIDRSHYSKPGLTSFPCFWPPGSSIIGQDQVRHHTSAQGDIGGL